MNESKLLTFWTFGSQFQRSISVDINKSMIYFDCNRRTLKVSNLSVDKFLTIWFIQLNTLWDRNSSFQSKGIVTTAYKPQGNDLFGREKFQKNENISEGIIIARSTPFYMISSCQCLLRDAINFQIYVLLRVTY